MHVVALLVASLFTVAAPSEEILKQYRTAAASVGHSPEANLKLALWCEQNGLDPEREKHLSMVIVADPNNAVARGLLGQVQEEGKWRTPSAVTERIQKDPSKIALLDEYASRRDKTPNTVDAHWKLGLWCEKKDLKREATAHFVAIIRLSPNHEVARNRLGYRKLGSRWISDAQLAWERRERDAQAHADRRWHSTLQSLQRTLENTKGSQAAERSLASVSDPRAVPAVMQVFGKSDQDRAVQLLGQIEGPNSTRALTWLAVFAKTAETRRVATEILRRRDPREFVGDLIAQVRDPIKYKIDKPAGPGKPATLHIEGVKVDVNRIYRPTSVPNVPLLPGDTYTVDQFGLPVILRVLDGEWMPVSGWSSAASLLGMPGAETGVPAGSFASAGGVAKIESALPGGLAAPFVGALQDAIGNERASRDFYNWAVGVTYGASPVYRRETLLLEQERIPIGQMTRAAVLANEQLDAKLASDVNAIETTNAVIRAGNDRVLPVLESSTGESFGPDREAWQRWWTDAQGYAQSQAPTKSEVVEEVVAMSPQIMPQVALINGGQRLARHSCFGRETPVRTLTGLTAIETLKIGDLVLAGDTTTGRLSYQPIVAVHHNPPAETLKIELGTDAVVATGIHRFWKAGKGWIMARDLKPGDIVRTVDGSSRVESVTDAPTQPVFNLEIADGHSFFVGKAGALVHDNSLVQPVTDPFDAPSELVAANRP